MLDRDIETETDTDTQRQTHNRDPTHIAKPLKTSLRRPFPQADTHTSQQREFHASPESPTCAHKIPHTDPHTL